jgi:hypothetical protein
LAENALCQSDPIPIVSEVFCTSSRQGQAECALLENALHHGCQVASLRRRENRAPKGAARPPSPTAPWPLAAPLRFTDALPN